MWRANYMHWSTPLFIEELSIYGFGYPLGVMLQYIRIFNCARKLVSLTPELFKGQLCLYGEFNRFSKVKLSLHFWHKPKLTMIYLFIQSWIIFVNIFVRICASIYINVTSKINLTCWIYLFICLVNFQLLIQLIHS